MNKKAHFTPTTILICIAIGILAGAIATAIATYEHKIKRWSICLVQKCKKLQKQS